MDQKHAEHDEPLLGERPLEESSKTPIGIKALPWLIHGLVIITYSAIFLAIIFPTINEGKGRPLPLPDREGLEWEDRRFPTDIDNNPFSGPPRAELDSAWHDLLQNDNIHVPIGYLREKNLTSVYTKNHSEGIASLSVYHSLHCLKKVQRMMNKEHYYADRDETSMAREVKHADHCLEYIRESLMCQPDLSLVTFRWINETAQHDDPTQFYPTNFDIDMHRCASWEKLDQWAGERAFDLYRVELLDRPGSD